jgi:4-amino-4-deoxy-L-arabinose transferase-like glycosyltransferase
MRSRSTYILLFVLTAFVYIIGLFIPLMDNDAAHHANIALRMYLTGDYVNLIDNGQDYLDKPHLHFWLAALSYKLFGVSAFAYRFPSFLFSILGIYSIYRLGKIFYNEEVAKASALIFATSFGYMLSLTDVRMDAILVATISFSCWQLVALIYTGRLWYVGGSAMGLAIGFAVKGSIGVAVPVVFIAWFALFQRSLKPKTILYLFLTFLLLILFIFPILYCYYLQFDLHPEKVIRGRDHIKGVRYILFGQGAERFEGKMSTDSRKDPFFFPYTFIWAFAPWALFCYVAIIRSLRKIKAQFPDSFIAFSFLSIALLITFAGSKLPHYLNVVFPFAALLTASFLQTENNKYYIRLITICLSILTILTALIINLYFFSFSLSWPAIIGIAIVVIIIGSMQTRMDPFQKNISWLAASILFLFLLLNSSFYPKLLKYQGGQELARLIKNKIEPGRIYFWPKNYSSSFCFSQGTLRQEFVDSVLNKTKPAWLVFDKNYEPEIEKSGYVITERTEVKDFEITKLDRKFLEPSTRNTQCSKLVIGRINRITSN